MFIDIHGYLCISIRSAGHLRRVGGVACPYDKNSPPTFLALHLSIYTYPYLAI